MVDASDHPPYGFDFFETIIAVHWPSSQVGYVLLQVSAVTTINGSIPPPCPSVALNIAAEMKTIQVVSACVPVTIPAHNVTTKFFFVWPTGAPFPDVTNFDNQVETDVSYAGQFSEQIDINSSGFGSPGSHGIAGASSNGFYSSLANAAVYASNFNARMALSPPGSTLTYFNSAIGSGETTISFLGISAAELDVTTLVPASSTATLTYKALIQVPPGLSILRPTVTVGPGTSTMLGWGLSGTTLTSVAQALTQSPDSISGDVFNGTGTYTVTNILTINPGSESHATDDQVTVVGGGTGGSGH
jgi:hypothetical protein